MKESTSQHVTHEVEVMINYPSYRNKMDVNNLLNYPNKNYACSEVQSLKEVMDITEKDIVDKLKMIQYFWSQLRVRNHVSHRTLHNFMV